MNVQSILGPLPFFSFEILYTVTRPTYTHASSDFEPTISEFEGAKTVHVLDLSATVIGEYNSNYTKRRMAGCLCGTFCSAEFLQRSQELCDEETLQMQRYFLFRYGSDNVKKGGFFLP
jgi:hypothetical protein